MHIEIRHEVACASHSSKSMEQIMSRARRRLRFIFACGFRDRNVRPFACGQYSSIRGIIQKEVQCECACAMRFSKQHWLCSSMCLQPVWGKECTSGRHCCGVRLGCFASVCAKGHARAGRGDRARAWRWEMVLPEAIWNVCRRAMLNANVRIDGMVCALGMWAAMVERAGRRVRGSQGSHVCCAP